VAPFLLRCRLHRRRGNKKTGAEAPVSFFNRSTGLEGVTNANLDALDARTAAG